ncbi:MAG: hypothetical protein AB7G11_11900 [Phycisphaerales bacterium]
MQPIDPAARKKLIIVAVITGFLVLFAGYVLYRTLTPPPRAQEPESKLWELARELNEALASRPDFADTSFFVESEDPPKLTLTGQVKTPSDLEALRQFVQQTKPEVPQGQYDYTQLHIVRPN